MIAVDTSAVMAIALGEREAEACIAALGADPQVLISAGTLAELLIVAGRHDLGAEVAGLVERLSFEVVAVTAAAARRIADAYVRWGKGNDSAGLNFGDCFAYDVAKDHACPLLYVGKDFSKTDVESVL